MKEFVEQLKLYKEFIAIMAAVIGGSLFIANYFATKDALEKAKDQLAAEVGRNRRELAALVDERGCHLEHRITVADSNAQLVRFERDRIARSHEKITLQGKTGSHIDAAELAYTKERLEQITSELGDIEHEIDGLKTEIKQATKHIDAQTCSVSVRAPGEHA